MFEKEICEIRILSNVANAQGLNNARDWLRKAENEFRNKVDDLFREMTPEEADAEYDAAPSIPISKEEIDRMVKAATKAKPAEMRVNQ